MQLTNEGKYGLRIEMMHGFLVFLWYELDWFTTVREILCEMMRV